jgi:hypothetical protein
VEDHWGEATTPPDHREHEQSPKNEEDHRGEQVTTPSDLEEVGQHREQGTVAWSTPTDGDHREEQGSREGAVAWSSSVPHSLIAGLKIGGAGGLVARSQGVVPPCCKRSLSKACRAPLKLWARGRPMKNTGSFGGHGCKVKIDSGPVNIQDRACYRPLRTASIMVNLTLKQAHGQILSTTACSPWCGMITTSTLFDSVTLACVFV